MTFVSLLTEIERLEYLCSHVLLTEGCSWSEEVTETAWEEAETARFDTSESVFSFKTIYHYHLLFTGIIL